MSEFKFTPGPWKLMPEEVGKDYVRVRGTVIGGRWKVANVPTVAYSGVPDREAEETRANARLIAAAPDLLRELSNLAACLHLWIESGRSVPGIATLNGAFAAIKKATQP